MDLETTTLKMEDFPIGLFSDLHADLGSLESLLRTEPEVQRWFCVGDYIEMRAFKEINSPVLERCQAEGILGVRGNHDNDALALKKVSAEGEAFLDKLPDALVLECPFGRVGLFHATPDSDRARCEQDDIHRYVPLFQQLNLQHVFVGHIHETYYVESEGIHIRNLGHLEARTFGDAKQTYALISAGGSVNMQTLHPLK
jgi:predicted phosphodiesterase